MPAGYNMCINIIRITTPTDDDVGGAMITGTVIHDSIWARMEHRGDPELLLAQGYETEKIATFMIPYFDDIREKDQLEVVSPFDHYYINQRFRIVSIRPSSYNPRDPRRHLNLTTTRMEYAHANPNQ